MSTTAAVPSGTASNGQTYAVDVQQRVSEEHQYQEVGEGTLNFSRRVGTPCDAHIRMEKSKALMSRAFRPKNFQRAQHPLPPPFAALPQVKYVGEKLTSPAEPQK